MHAFDMQLACLIKYAICFTFVVTLLLFVICQEDTGRIGSPLRLQQDDSVSDKRKPICPGPVLEPSEREEPWNQKFSEELNKEVESKDADKVQHPDSGCASTLAAALN